MIRAFTIAALMFSTMVLIFVASASLPYVPNLQIVPVLFPLTSATIFASFLAVLTIYKGTTNQPAGFRYLTAQWRNGKFFKALKIAFSIPVFSALLGYVMAAFLATAPAYPTFLLSKERSVASAECLSSGRDKVRGTWSIFRLNSGESWKVAGYGGLCDKNSKDCKIEYLQGYLGSYITKVACENG